MTYTEIKQRNQKKYYYRVISIRKGKKINKFLEIRLIYENGRPKIAGVERVSRLSRRMYYGVRDIRPVVSGYGSLVLTTTKGILNDAEARKERVGGEALFKIW